jgi:CRP/FNR family transcriptional regulator, dissimilatory nitrate respiration regulator
MLHLTEYFNFVKNITMNYELLSHSPIFKGLDAATTEMILGKINYRIRKYPVGSVIAISGEEITSLHIVLAGMVKGEMVDYEGRTLKIEDIGAPRGSCTGFHVRVWKQISS